MAKILCVIPARLQSTRLPRKPLAIIKGKPMIQWVYEAAVSCLDIDKVIVATDATEIADVIEKLGGHAEMTPTYLNTGSDRVAIVAKKFPEYSVVINLQGDQPFTTGDMLSALLAPYLHGENVRMTTLATPINFSSDYNEPDTVKVVYDKNFDALYFSRSPIPFFRDLSSRGKDTPVAAHLGLYAYDRNFLLKYAKMEQTPLEKAELLEQLRVLEHGHKIRVCFTNKRILEVNTPEDLQRAQKEGLHLCR